MASADVCKDAVNFVSSCTVGQLLGEEVMRIACGIHLGRLWHFTCSLTSAQPNGSSCFGPYLLSITCRSQISTWQSIGSKREENNQSKDVSKWVIEVNTAAGFYWVALETWNGSNQEEKTRWAKITAHIWCKKCQCVGMFWLVRYCLFPCAACWYGFGCVSTK